MQNEIELKLRINTKDIIRLRRHAAIRQHLTGTPMTRRLVSIYYDTPDLQLLKKKISLRVRRMSGGWFQAVKSSGHSLAGLHQRMEWEDIIAHGHPDFTKITEPSLAKIFADQNLRNALQPIFLTDVKRTEWQLAYEDGTAIEVALDLGQLEVGAKSEPISEVELELKKGEAWRLFELAALLQQTIPLQIENISKAERGYRHFQPAMPAASHAQTVKLPAKSTSAKAFQAIGLECLRQMQANQELVMQADVEATHQMHIAVRRLKVAFKLFGFKNPAILTELDWLNQLLGNARNWDVLATETLPQLLPQAPEHEVMQALVEKKRHASYLKLKQAFESQRYQALLLSLGTELTRKSEEGRRSAKTLLQRRLQRIDRKLPWAQARLDTLSQEQLHRARIHFKRLRYMQEFFNQSEFGQLSIKSIIRLQKQMGTLNDLRVGNQLLASITRSLPVDLKKAMTEKISSRSNQLTQIAKLRMQSCWEKVRQKKSGHN
jgi:inorganic triphosphatase YgiF